MVDEEADVVQNEVVVKCFADVAEFDEVARRGRLWLVKYSRAHAGPLLLMSLREESNQMFSGMRFRAQVITAESL